MLFGKFTNKNGKIVNGENVKFSVICDKCGANARLTPKRYFEYQNNMNPTKITLEFECSSCNNKFIAIIHK